MQDAIAQSRRKRQKPSAKCALNQSAMKSFAVTTLGCKVNQYDACAVSTALVGAQLRPARPGESPDLIVINTCCVTAEAMRKSRQAIRRAVRKAPDAHVFILGCYGDYDAAGIRQLLVSMDVRSDKALVAGPCDDLAKRVRALASRLTARGPDCPAPIGQDDATAGERDEVLMSAVGRPARVANANSYNLIKAPAEGEVKENFIGTQGLGPIGRFGGRQRAFVKVQDGCDAMCTYCVVCHTRRRLWSRSIDEVVAECRALVAAGHREIVLCGVFLGAYGRATAVRKRWQGEASRLPGLLRAVAGIDGLWRVRLSSLEPGDLNGDLLSACGDLPNFAPHFHLPLQSGSPRILRSMNRQYTAAAYRRTIDRLRAALESPAVTTDILVGFPSEGDADFAATLEMARYAGFAKIHAFPFSPIEPTAAWRRRDQAPPPNVVKARLAELAQVERLTARAFRRQFVGRTMEALVERPRRPKSRSRQAMTDRYITVHFDAPKLVPPESLTGQIVRLQILEITDDGATGHLVDD